MKQTVQQKPQQEPEVARPNLTGIPTQMKRDFETRSGLSFDDVRVHYNSDKPAQLQALAYAQGTQVHIGRGQERHLPHELGHVVQQKRGLVKPTAKHGKTQINNNQELEQEATNMGKSFQGYMSHTPKRLTCVPENSVVQRSPITIDKVGTFKDIGFVLQDNTAKGVRSLGAKMIITFTPDSSLGTDGDIVSLIQTVKDTTYKKNSESGVKTLSWAAQIDAFPKLRAESEDDYIIDQIITEPYSSVEQAEKKSDTNVNTPVYVNPNGTVSHLPTKCTRKKRKFVNLDPRYTEKRTGESESERTQESIITDLINLYKEEPGKLDSFPELKGVVAKNVNDDNCSKCIADELNTNAIYGATYSAIKKDGAWTPARLSDEPLFPVNISVNPLVGGSMEFEVAAFFEPRNVPKKYLGLITWGWRINEEKKINEAATSLIDMKLVEDFTKFDKAVNKWNSMKFDIPNLAPLTIPNYAKADEVKVPK